MRELFVAQFKASIAYALLVNTQENIKRRENETLNEYFKRFNEQVLKVKRASKEALKNFLIAGIRLGTDFWKTL